MRKIIVFLSLLIISYAFVLSVADVPFGISKTKVGNYYINRGIEQTGAANIVTSVVVNYRGFD